MKTYINEYLVQMEVDGKAENTINNTRVRLNTMTKDIPTLDKLTKTNINQYILKLKENHKESTVNEHIKTIRTFVRYLYEEGYIDKDIPIKTIKETVELSTVVSDDEVEYIISSLKKEKSFKYQRNLTIFMTFIYTGVRVSELVEIKLNDIDGDTMKIYGKKTKTYRLIPIPPQLKLQLQKYMRSRSKQNITSPYLFVNRCKVKCSILCVQDIIKKISKDTGIYMHCHMLRHYFAINMIKRGVPIVIVSKLLGHICIETTMTYVREISNEEVLEVYNKY